MTGRISWHWWSLSSFRKHFGSNFHSVTVVIFKSREETCTRPVPPAEDSQPIPSVWLDNEVHVANKGSPYLTTTAGGFIATGQMALTGSPRSKQYRLLLTVQTLRYKHIHKIINKKVGGSITDPYWQHVKLSLDETLTPCSSTTMCSCPNGCPTARV